MSMEFLQPGAQGKPAAPLPFSLSPIKRMHSAWRYLWPFQSRKALVTTLYIQAGGSLAWTAILLWLDPGPLPFALVGALIGGMYMGPYRVLSVQMTITTRSEARFHVDVVRQLILRMAYMAGGPTGEVGHVRYVHKWSVKLYGWLSYDQDLDLRWRDKEIELRGPVNAIEWLHRQLTKQLES